LSRVLAQTSAAAQPVAVEEENHDAD
jgi:hypothetical protein